MTRAGIWFRQDLRQIDNQAVAEAQATAAGEMIPALYLAATEQWQEHDWAAIKIDLLWRHLTVFQKELAAANIQLEVVICKHWREAPKHVYEFCQRHDLTEIHGNNDYPVHERRRDRAVESWLAKHEIDFKRYHSNLLVPPVVYTQQGKVYQKFTPFYRAWKNYLREHGVLQVAKARTTRAECESLGLPDCPLPKRKSSNAWRVGEEAVIQQLDHYLTEFVVVYQQQRDFPALDTTSRLSPYFELGMLSPITAARRLQHQSAQFPDGLEEGEEVWLSELAWREFYQHLMQHVPRLSYHQAFQRHTDQFPWRTGAQADEDFQRWCDGQTGFPIVDAGMRQLREEGWMHNRVRMIVASFLVKDLRIDWRRGERFFMRQLIDGSFPANNGGWQWSASTGVDAVPYFRVFNPTTQSQKVDPSGSYIRKWVNELADCPNKYIHAPAAWLAIHSEVAYPTPIVDHKQARELFLSTFKQL